MTSSNRRERELARAKRERQLARAAQPATQNQRWLLLAAIAAVLVVVYFMTGNGNSNAKPGPDNSVTPTNSASQTALDADCTTAPAPQASPKQWTTGPTKIITDKTATWTLHTNCGDIVIDMAAKAAPYTVNSMKFLTDNSWYNGTPCHRLTTAGLFVLQCGDATGTGAGGPGYTIPDENLPTNAANNYPAGTVAMANAGANTGGSQFFIVYGDTTLGPDYTIFGRVTSGLDIVKKLASYGVAGGGTDGAPAQPIGIVTAEFTQAK